MSSSTALERSLLLFFFFFFFFFFFSLAIPHLHSSPPSLTSTHPTTVWSFHLPFGALSTAKCKRLTARHARLMPMPHPRRLPLRCGATAPRRHSRWIAAERGRRACRRAQPFGPSFTGTRRPEVRRPTPLFAPSSFCGRFAPPQRIRPPPPPPLPCVGPPCLVCRRLHCLPPRWPITCCSASWGATTHNFARKDSDG